MTPLATRGIVLRDYAERVLSTFVQVYLAVVLASATGAVDWLDAFYVALFAAVVSVVTSVIAVALTLRPTGAYPDLVYRTVVTFLQSLLGYLVAAGTTSAILFDWSSAFKLSLIAAAGALLKGLIGLRSTETVGASVFVVAPDTKTPAG